MKIKIDSSNKNFFLLGNNEQRESRVYSLKNINGELVLKNNYNKDSLYLHTTIDKVILNGKTLKDYQNNIYVFSNAIKEVIFHFGINSATTETSDPDNGGGTSAPSDPGTGFRVNPQEETEKTATKPAVSMQKSNTVAPVNTAKSLTIWQQIQKFFSDIYKKMTS